MQNNNLTLFKKAIRDGLCNKIDSIANSCTDEIVCSEKHRLAVRTIVYGKIDAKRIWSPRVRRLIAILIAAALLLTSCGIIFRNEIREVFEDFFVKFVYEGENETLKTIKEVYYPSYIPEGYTLEKESITSTRVKYKFLNDEGELFYFEQRPLDCGEFVVDSESGYSKIETVNDFEVYYRLDNNYHSYIWNNESYFMKIISTSKLTNEDVALILDGIIT